MQEIRPYRKQDRPALLALLAFLPTRYPGADQWLRSRLTDVEEGHARCTVVQVDQSLGAVMIETPKPLHAIKVSTFYVAPNYRQLGLAQALLQQAQSRWVKDSIERVYATVDSQHPSLPFYLRLGFKVAGSTKDRYVIGSEELLIELPVLSTAPPIPGQSGGAIRPFGNETISLPKRSRRALQRSKAAIASAPPPLPLPLPD